MFYLSCSLLAFVREMLVAVPESFFVKERGVALFTYLLALLFARGCYCWCGDRQK